MYPNCIASYFIDHMESCAFLVKPFTFVLFVNLVTPVVIFVGRWLCPCLVDNHCVLGTSSVVLHLF